MIASNWTPIKICRNGQPRPAAHGSQAKEVATSGLLFYTHCRRPVPCPRPKILTDCLSARLMLHQSRVPLPLAMSSALGRFRTILLTWTVPLRPVLTPLKSKRAEAKQKRPLAAHLLLANLIMMVFHYCSVTSNCATLSIHPLLKTRHSACRQTQLWHAICETPCVEFLPPLDRIEGRTCRWKPHHLLHCRAELATVATCMCLQPRVQT